MPNAKRLKPVRRTKSADRICHVVNEWFGGSLNAAAKALGVGYDPLRRAALGLTVRAPATELLVALSRYTQESVGWYAGEDRA
jgi:hypothetical protein